MFKIGSLSIYWYGLILALAMLAGIGMAIMIGRFYKVKAETIVDFAFWLIIGGLIGARLYYVGLEWAYYKDDPLSILKIWQGGLAIHGAILFGLLSLWLFVRRRKLDFWLLASIVVPALALAQAIGRWGNYFNQELFGLPTAAPWGIPIAEINRPAAYLQNSYFHPTFLYESIGNLVLFGFLCLAHWLSSRETANKQLNHKAIVLGYLIFYSVLRFVMEEFRIDEVPAIGHWRWPQIFSLALALISLAVLIMSALKQRRKEKEDLFL